MVEEKKREKNKFELFEHTADIGVRAFGDNLPIAFENAARGMFAIIFHGSSLKIKPIGQYNIKLQASDLEQLIVDWLDEILYIFSTENIVFSNYKISINEETYDLDAKINGEIIPANELLGTCEIKAVTYHMLSVTKNKHWVAQVIFDI